MNAPARNPTMPDPAGAMDLNTAGLFLVGAERSGTTMLRLMLDHHAAIAWQNEFEYAVDRVSDSGEFPGVDAFREFLDQHRVFRANGYAIDHTLGYAAIVRSFLDQCRTRAGKPIVGATVHRHFDRLLHIWPDARFIHLVRDPRDVAPSVIGMGWAGNVYHASARWLEAERAWDRVASRVGPGRFIEVRFERLLADPEGELARMCAFIGVQFNDSMLAFHERTTYSPPDATAAQRWTSKLSPRDVGLIEGRLGSLIEDRGYERSGHAPIVPGLLHRARLRMQNKAAHVRWNLDRYGLGLYLRAQFAKRLRSGEAWARVKREIHEIDRGHLK